MMSRRRFRLPELRAIVVERYLEINQAAYDSSEFAK